MKDKTEILILDWTGATLYEGSYKNESEINKVLDANRCNCENDMTALEHEIMICPNCNDTGYLGDIEIYWKYPELQDKESNVFDYINY